MAVRVKNASIVSRVAPATFFEMLRRIIIPLTVLVDQLRAVLDIVALAVQLGALVTRVGALLAAIPVVFRDVNVGCRSATTFAGACETMTASVSG